MRSIVDLRPFRKSAHRPARRVSARLGLAEALMGGLRGDPEGSADLVPRRAASACVGDVAGRELFEAVTELVSEAGEEPHLGGRQGTIVSGIACRLRFHT